METSSDSVVNTVIEQLRSQNRDLSTVTLEEAKEITFQILRNRRSASRKLEVIVEANETPYRVLECSV